MIAADEQQDGDTERDSADERWRRLLLRGCDILYRHGTRVRSLFRLGVKLDMTKERI
jgi:hypothetical protein